MTPPSGRSLAAAAALGALLAFAVRGAVVAHAPWNYAFDALQRWGGRDHLWVQVWLPGAQAIIAGVARLGGQSADARLALAAVAALAVGAAAVWAGRAAGGVAAWAMLAVGVYGPFVTWSAALYQEGTYLLCLLGGLAAAVSGRLLLGDVLVGLAALVRFEAWPCLLLWVAWRRDPRALVALLPALGWELGRRLLGLVPFAASPVDYDDRVGLVERFRVGRWLHGLGELGQGLWDSGGVAWALAAGVGVSLGWRRPGVRLLVGWLVVQLAATGAWMAGLETSTKRMLVLPGVYLGCLGAVGVAEAWARWPALRPGLVTGLFALGVYGAVDGWRGAEDEQEKLLPEAQALGHMARMCPDCTWWVEPRTGLGTRDRHDGCEVLQGLSQLRHAEEFWCAGWVPEAEQAARRAATGGDVRWRGTVYVVTLRPPG